MAQQRATHELLWSAVKMRPCSTNCIVRNEWQSLHLARKKSTWNMRVIIFNWMCLMVVTKINVYLMQLQTHRCIWALQPQSNHRACGHQVSLILLWVKCPKPCWNSLGRALRIWSRVVSTVLEGLQEAMCALRELSLQGRSGQAGAGTQGQPLKL